MNQKEMKQLKEGDIVTHKRTGERFVFYKLNKAWDGIPPNLTREHMEACCKNSKGDFKYFEAREIMKGE